MKKMTLVLTFLVVQVLSSVVHGQSFYTVIGDNDEWHGVVVIRIIDKETHLPVSDAVVNLDSYYFDHPVKLRTDRGGVIVLIIKVLNDSYAEDVSGEVTARGYRYQTINIEKSDYNHEANRTSLELPDYENTQPTDRQIAHAIREGRYNVYARNLLGPRRVGCLVQTFELQRIETHNDRRQEPSKHEPDNHKDRKGYDSQPGERRARNCRYIDLPEEGCFRVVPLRSSFDPRGFCQEMGYDKAISAELIRSRVTGRVRICCGSDRQNSQQVGSPNQTEQLGENTEQFERKQDNIMTTEPNGAVLKRFVETAQENGSGIATRNLTRSDREEINRAMGQVWYMIGLVVAYVDPESPAHEAGLREGIIISNVWANNTNSWAPTDAGSFDTIMRNRNRGDRIRLAIWRQREGNDVKKGYGGSEEKGKWYRDEVIFEF